MKRNFFSLTINGIKKNIIPGIILWIVALFIVLIYYFYIPSKLLFNFISNLKSSYGFLFSIISTMIFAGIIPYLYLVFSGKIEKEMKIKEFLFYIFFWGWKGFEVDLLYRFQGLVFGTSPDFFVILKKTLIDQFVYNTFWAAPATVILYLWKDNRFSLKKLRTNINIELFIYKIPSLLISTWVIWIPAVSIIYCFPPALQIPIFNIVVCFWVLFLSILGENKEEQA